MSDPRYLTPKELAAKIDRLEFLLQTAPKGTNTRELERGLNDCKAESRRREKLSKTK